MLQGRGIWNDTAAFVAVRPRVWPGNISVGVVRSLDQLKIPPPKGSKVLTCPCDFAVLLVRLSGTFPGNRSFAEVPEVEVEEPVRVPGNAVELLVGSVEYLHCGGHSS